MRRELWIESSSLILSHLICLNICDIPPTQGSTILAILILHGDHKNNPYRWALVKSWASWSSDGEDRGKMNSSMTNIPTNKITVDFNMLGMFMK